MVERDEWLNVGQKGVNIVQLNNAHGHEVVEELCYIGNALLSKILYESIWGKAPPLQQQAKS